jgi:hypothetical protein
MGVIISDNAKATEDLYASFWQWHPVVDLIDSMQIIDKERITLMHEKVPVAVNPTEAHQIGKRIKAQILPQLRSGKRLLLNMEMTSVPNDAKMHYDDPARNYSASIEWLEHFADFCLVCDGFTNG